MYLFLRILGQLHLFMIDLGYHIVHSEGTLFEDILLHRCNLLHECNNIHALVKQYRCTNLLLYMSSLVVFSIDAITLLHNEEILLHMCLNKYSEITALFSYITV